MSPAKIALTFALLAVTACATTPPPPPAPITVEVPVPVPCTPAQDLLPPRARERAFDTLPPSATTFDRIRALLIDRERDIPAIDALWIALDSCSARPPLKPP